MDKIFHLVFFLSILMMAYGQLYNLKRESQDIIPEKCFGSNDILFNRHCCVVPAFFDRNVVRSCGGVFELREIHKKEGFAMARRHFVPDCEFWECVLDKYKILSADKLVNEEKFFDHLDKWAALNKPFSTLIMSGKIHCKQNYLIFMPLSTCEFYNFLRCIRDYLSLYDCPVLIQSKECFDWKDFFDECKQYYT